jgi:hypothetical protein
MPDRIGSEPYIKKAPQSSEAIFSDLLPSR